MFKIFSFNSTRQMNLINHVHSLDSKQWIKRKLKTLDSHVLFTSFCLIHFMIGFDMILTGGWDELVTTMSWQSCILI